jgi:2-iminobutanoate/2-iminopropanoate deaminase
MNFITTEKAPAAIGPYSQAVESGGVLYCSGQIPLDPATGEMVSGEIKTETRQVLDNLAAVLDAGGSSLEHVLKTTIYLVQMSDFAAVNEVYGSYFSGSKPARATVAVAALPRGARVEIDAIAVLKD